MGWAWNAEAATQQLPGPAAEYPTQADVVGKENAALRRDRAYSGIMTHRQTAIAASPYAGAERILPGFQFADAYKVEAPRGLDAIEATRLAFAHGPLWIRGLMGLRNRLGRLVGLRPAPASGFPVVSQAADEVVLGFNDKHLDFRIVVAVAGGFATVTTIVRWHNAWGRAYLAAIMPFHRAIAARMIEGVA
jgi:hypothetical protein